MLMNDFFFGGRRNLLVDDDKLYDNKFLNSFPKMPQWVFNQLNMQKQHIFVFVLSWEMLRFITTKQKFSGT